MMFDSLQKKIESFIGDYGTETLIQYLNDFENISSKKNYQYIESVCQSVSVTYKINKQFILDINNLKPEVVDARRQIVCFLTIEKQLPTKILSTLFNCKTRTIYKYQREVKDRLKNQNIYKEYVNNYKQIKAQIEDVSTKH